MCKNNQLNLCWYFVITDLIQWVSYAACHRRVEIGNYFHEVINKLCLKNRKFEFL